MPLHISWQQIALRLLLASVAGFIIGLNRDEHGNPAGVRTTMLVCLASTLAMIQVNLLLPLAGKPPSSFNVMDLMRLPLGILTGIGFIGGGVILKEGMHVRGVTTAATMWFVTVLGLLFGGGNLYLGITATIMAFLILWALKLLQRYLTREFHGTVCMEFSSPAPEETELRRQLSRDGCRIEHWNAKYDPPEALTRLECELCWRDKTLHVPHTPLSVEQLRAWPGVTSVVWKE